MKKVLAIYGKGNVGKSQTIKEFYKLLLKKYPDLKIVIQPIIGGDIRYLIDINGILIGIESQGDPNSRLFDSLKLFIELNCTLIICATRTKGATCEAVNDLKNNGFDVKWIAKKVEPNLTKRETVNMSEAENLLNKVIAYL